MDAFNTEDEVIEFEVETTSNDELLIMLVRQYPHLYDNSAKGYKDEMMKVNSWTAIAQVLNSNVEECQHAWKRLRTRFGREIKKLNVPSGSAGGATRPQWSMLPIMEFLRPIVKARRGSGNFDKPFIVAGHKSPHSSQSSIGLSSHTSSSSSISGLASPVASSPSSCSSLPVPCTPSMLSSSSPNLQGSAGSPNVLASSSRVLTSSSPNLLGSNPPATDESFKRKKKKLDGLEEAIKDSLSHFHKNFSAPQAKGENELFAHSIAAMFNRMDRQTANNIKIKMLQMCAEADL